MWAVSLPFGIAGLWWQHHWGLGPFDVTSGCRAALRARGERGVRAGHDRAARRARRAVPALWWIPGAAVFVALASCSSFVSGWLAAAGTDPLQDPGLRADIRQISRTEGVNPPVRVQKVSDWTDQANAFAVGLRPVDARRALGHAARRPLLARRDRRRRRARVRARQAPAHTQGRRLVRAVRVSRAVPRRRGDAPPRRPARPREPAARRARDHADHARRGAAPERSLAPLRGRGRLARAADDARSRRR